MSLLSETDRQQLAEYWYGDDTAQVDEIIDTVVRHSRTSGFVQYVDGFAQEQDTTGIDPEFNEITIVVPEIKPEVLFESFGWESVVWAAAHARQPEKSRLHYAAAQTLLDKEPDAVYQSVSWSRHAFNDARAAHIASQITLAETLEDIAQDDVSTLVKSHPADGVVISAKRASEYGLVPLQPNSNDLDGFVSYKWPCKPDTYYGIYSDGPRGVALTYRDLPIAFASFGLQTNNEVGVLQLQGVTGIKEISGDKLSPRGLAPIDWRGLFIDIADMSAQQIKADGVSIVSSGHNKWLHRSYDTEDGKDCDVNRRLNSAAAIRNYDAPAIAHGFTLGDDNNWHRPL